MVLLITTYLLSVRQFIQVIHPEVISIQEALAAFLADEGDGAADDGPSPSCRGQTQTDGYLPFKNTSLIRILLHVFFAGFITGATTDTCQT